MQKLEPNFLPISMIPTILRIVEEILESSVSQLDILQQEINWSYALDDKLAARITAVYTKQRHTIDDYLKQCVKWREKQLTEIQSAQVEAIENTARSLSLINDKILYIVKEFEAISADSILKKDDTKLALEFLLNEKL